MTDRKVIQIIPLASHFLGITLDFSLLALCDDGSIWQISSKKGAKWELSDQQVPVAHGGQASSDSN